MQFVEAWLILQIPPTCDPQEIQLGYRAAMRRVHPDLHHTVEAHEQTALVTAAHQSLLDGIDSGELRSHVVEKELERLRKVDLASKLGDLLGSHAQPGSTSDEPDVFVLDDESGLKLHLDRSASMNILLEALNNIGDVCSIDFQSGIAQTVISFTNEPTCYFHISLADEPQTECTIVNTTIESIETRPAPPVANVVTLLADELSRLSQHSTSTSAGASANQ